MKAEICRKQTAEQIQVHIKIKIPTVEVGIFSDLYGNLNLYTKSLCDFGDVGSLPPVWAQKKEQEHLCAPVLFLGGERAMNRIQN